MFFKKTRIFSKLLKMANLLWNAYQMILFHKKVFFPIEGFLQNFEKKINLEKLHSLMEKEFQRKAFIFLKSIFNKLDGQNLPW